MVEGLRYIPPETRNGQKVLEFEYSPENPPPLEVLESKIFAVHATSILPEGGKLKASAQNLSEIDKSKEGEPPSFRPTIHFALGELVQEHSDWSWDESPYAVISPLKNLEGQLVNVFPHDTFVLGDVQLQEGMILLVPQGTDISRLTHGCEIKEYDPKVGLRQAVDSVISEKKGWHIKMKPEGVSIGSVAYIGDIEVNDSRFFRSLFEEYPHISFGTHINPERGDAFRFGLIDRALDKVMKNYSDHWLRYSTVEVSLHRSLIVHNLQRLEQAIKNSPIDPGAVSAFEEKKAKLHGWLNIIDCDLEIRERRGKTFTGASQSIQEEIRARRNSLVELKEFVDKQSRKLPKAIQESELSPSYWGIILSAMAPEELARFKTSNEAVFAHVRLPEFFAQYAVRRWIVIKNEQAQKEGLDQLLTNSLAQFTEKPEEAEGVFENLEKYLNEESNRLGVALTILRNPAVKKYLAEKFDIQFKEDGPANLQEVIAAHPKTKVLFESQEFTLSDDQEEARQFLGAIDGPYEPTSDVEEAIKDIEKARSLAFSTKQLQDKLHEDLIMVTKPMNVARDPNKIKGGTVLTLYEILRTYEKPVEVWRKVELDKEYRKKFKTDSVFWKSNLSLMEIYRALKASKNV